MTILKTEHCSVEGCNNSQLARGLCGPHYRQNRKAERLERDCLSVQPTSADTTSAQEPLSTPPMTIPYPGFEHFPVGEHGGRAFSKTLVNIMTAELYENPKHPKRAEIVEMIERETRVAEMDDTAFFAHQLHEANPLHTLTRSEKLHCIRTLPVPIVNKLFPYL